MWCVCLVKIKRNKPDLIAAVVAVVVAPAPPTVG